MKFVRWLGAFGKSRSLEDAGQWEHSQLARQVAVEPLYRGRSLILHAKIGLEVDEARSMFLSGWCWDAYTEVCADGIIRARRGKDVEGQAPRRYRDIGLFLKAWNEFKRTQFKAKEWNRRWHGECAFDAPVYRAVVVKADSAAHTKGRAAILAARLKLPLKEIAT